MLGSAGGDCPCPLPSPDLLSWLVQRFDFALAETCCSLLTLPRAALGPQLPAQLQSFKASLVLAQA